MLSDYPRVLHVDTSYSPPEDYQTELWDRTLDYRVYDNTSARWRQLERVLHVDVLLALKARQVSKEFDVVWSGSERVAIPLALMGLGRPLVTLSHHIAAWSESRPFKLLDPSRAWSRVGYLCNADRDILRDQLGISDARLFRYIAAPLHGFAPGAPALDGMILSAGVMRRDYGLLIAALRQLPGYRTEIYASSRYQEQYRGALEDVPEWVETKGAIPNAEMVSRYDRARFVVLPLFDSSQYSAGCSAALETAAAGKALIATRTKGMVDYVIDGETGLLVNPGDTEGMVNAIRALWEDPEWAHQMGWAARAFAERCFGPEEATSAARAAIISAYEESK